jgi:hypothetical protein
MYDFLVEALLFSASAVGNLLQGHYLCSFADLLTQTHHSGEDENMFPQLLIVT